MAASAAVERVLDHIREKWQRNIGCPYCLAVQWRVGEPVEIRLLGDQLLEAHVPIWCANCGHTVLVNADMAGVPDGDMIEEPGA